MNVHVAGNMENCHHKIVLAEQDGVSLHVSGIQGATAACCMCKLSGVPGLPRLCSIQM